MRRTWLLIGAFAFFVIAPGSIVGWIPYTITNWRVRASLPGIPGRIAGGLLLTGGVAVLIDSFLRFVVDGRGTPAPVAPPEYRANVPRWRPRLTPWHPATTVERRAR